VLWDFDGTLIPFDSEQFLLDSLPLAGLRALGARLFVYADRHGWDPAMLKVLYGWCLRQVSLTALEDICARIGTSIPEAERSALRALATRGVDMQVLSCGTADLSRGVLRAAGLADCFSRVLANPLIARDGRIAGIERRIFLPETKVDLVAQYGIPWEQIIAVGDGITDLPLLDRVGLPILIAMGKRAARFAGRGYRIVPSLAEAIALIGSQIE
jgi:phosphoserine phosphatase